MTAPTTLWEQYLKPIIMLFLDKDALIKLRNQINWEEESDRLSNPNLSYPNYYSSQNFHGIENGYLSIDAAITYDPITQYAVFPQEHWVREQLIDAIGGYPRRILDLGCGTGSSTLLLKQEYPQAEVIGLDLSPYMLVMAEHKAKEANLDIHWHHGLAEQTPWEGEHFDLVTATLLFHETPPAISKAILQEVFRLLTPGGQCIILDGSQTSLRQAEWITNIFEEPYMKAFAAGDLEQWMKQARFEKVSAEPIFWVNQVTKAMKPLPQKLENSVQVEHNLSSVLSPAF
ncbi:class I SAM-dependent methyltransferase [Roseofilum sp. Belize Diploria]|uniref:class I SAM-dependent methyltransferase n=1 Tax=Roseofilum sp. Belize Diploria TaxID=2821501 RepID=UPI000E9433F1|nr:methyltransferase domain-containing protein [Roseofilum sp. Belize Diploria]MBP0009468.1 class I SAM-dependent methyltransferase [Roseofilum sp. Belize Diploria]HBQ97076.1 methyltransferase type 11 [Cyanobacteria bacterium UBA11691]